MIKPVHILFLAHLSTKCSWHKVLKVLLVSYCGQWLSVVIRRVSTFDVYTLVSTFVVRFS